MSNEKEILTRFFKGDSQRTIAAVLHVSRNTMAKVVQAYQEHPMEASDLKQLNPETLIHHLFPQIQVLPVQAQPDYEFIHKELAFPRAVRHRKRKESLDFVKLRVFSPHSSHSSLLVA